MTVTKAWKIYGTEGHRQKESFNDSRYYDWSDGDNIRIVEVINGDRTGTNDYTILKITRNTDGECFDELLGQLDDGVFENCRTGKIEEVKK